MLLNLLRYNFRQCFISLSRNIGLALASMGIIAISLIILGAFILVAVNMEQMASGLESSVEVAVFLEDDAEEEAVEEELRHLEGVESYTFVSRHEGLEDISRELGDEDLLSEVEGEHNPLPDAFRVSALDAEIVPELAAQIENFTGVEKTDYGGELLNWMLRFGQWVNIISVGVALILIAAAVFLIVTTIRLSLLSRQEEVGIMKYLGASNWFIRFPFLLEGMIIGLVGTLVSVIILVLVYYNLASYLHDLELVFFWRPVTEPAILIPIWVGLLVLGTLIGGMGSLFSLRKFLKV